MTYVVSCRLVTPDPRMRFLHVRLATHRRCSGPSLIAVEDDKNGSSIGRQTRWTWCKLRPGGDRMVTGKKQDIYALPVCISPWA
jgi:hypothetical protein